MKKKNILIILGMLIVLVFVVGASYAVWQVTLTQTDKNTVTTSCFKIEFQDVNPINLEKSYPILDEEGKELTPYTFTVTNTCDTNARLQINLEILNDTTLENLSVIKVMLNEKIDTLTNKSIVSPTLDNAKSSYILKIGYLMSKESKTFSLRVWLNESTPAIKEYMEKTFISKVTVTASYLDNLDNNIISDVTSLNTGYDVTEAFSIHLVSEKYDIVEISDDGSSFQKLEEELKDITIEKIVSSNGTHLLYVKDEVGNISEVVINATKVDEIKPVANINIIRNDNAVTVDASLSRDNETSVVKYYFSKDNKNFIESDSSYYTFTNAYNYGRATSVLTDYFVNETKKVYLKVEDQNGNVSDIASIDIQSDFSYDATEDNNLRYMGSNPNNYVWFGEEYKTDIYDLYNSKENLFYGLNLESDSECMAFKNYLGNNSSSVSCIKTKNQKDKILWRIIGVMKNVKSNSYDNNSSSRIKLIRDDSIGPYAWDSSGISTNYGHGINEWSIADINLILNDYYYNNKANQICNVYINNVSLTCSFNKYGFPENLKKMTSPTLWYTGSNGSVLSTTNIKTAQFYKFERSNNIGKTCTSGIFCNDGSPRSVTWSGNIALMYPSEVGVDVCSQNLIL